MQMKAFTSKRSTSRGVSLIEVLVSVLILGIGLLGIAAMQALALGNSQSSVERTQAVIHSYSILDAMRANRDDAIAGNYSSGLICPGDAVPGAGISGADLATWIQSVRASLQTGCAQVQNNADVFTVTVQWNDQRGSGGNAAQQVVTVSRL